MSYLGPSHHTRTVHLCHSFLLRFCPFFDRLNSGMKIRVAGRQAGQLCIYTDITRNIYWQTIK